MLQVQAAGTRAGHVPELISPHITTTDGNLHHRERGLHWIGTTLAGSRQLKFEYRKEGEGSNRCAGDWDSVVGSASRYDMGHGSSWGHELLCQCVTKKRCEQRRLPPDISLLSASGVCFSGAGRRARLTFRSTLTFDDEGLGIARVLRQHQSVSFSGIIQRADDS